MSLTLSTIDKWVLSYIKDSIANKYERELLLTSYSLPIHQQYRKHHKNNIFRNMSTRKCIDMFKIMKWCYEKVPALLLVRMKYQEENSKSHHNNNINQDGVKQSLYRQRIIFGIRKLTANQLQQLYESYETIISQNIVPKT